MQREILRTSNFKCGELKKQWIRRYVYIFSFMINLITYLMLIQTFTDYDTAFAAIKVRETFFYTIEKHQTTIN